jgi:flagellar protein FliS
MLRGREVYETNQRETSVAIATPPELVVMVYDRLFEQLRMALSGLQADLDVAEPAGKALDLITDGLQSCLDRERGGEVAQNLDLLYNWACAEILRARLRRDPAPIEAVLRVLSPVAEAWREQAQALADKPFQALGI